IAQATEDAPVDSREVTLPGLCLVAKRFLRYFPTLEDLEIVRAWACVTPFTPDGLPVFGFSRAVPNFFTVAGFKGAFTTAPAVALHLAEAIHHGRVWDAHFSPDRTGEEQTPCST
ncbi:MAG: FAD-binding oxidoreductase, partial [Oscillospiraceae bacterium]|nr:FAD-binding oxidoreductase [Oscillospiraceae bacterium]